MFTHPVLWWFDGWVHSPSWCFYTCNLLILSLFFNPVFTPKCSSCQVLSSNINTKGLAAIFLAYLLFFSICSVPSSSKFLISAGDQLFLTSLLCVWYRLCGMWWYGYVTMYLDLLDTFHDCPAVVLKFRLGSYRYIAINIRLDDPKHARSQTVWKWKAFQNKAKSLGTFRAKLNGSQKVQKVQKEQCRQRTKSSMYALFDE